MPRKTVLVTGASRGIGKAIAVKFAKKGYNIAISCVHREDRLLQTQKEIEGFQVPCLAYKGDMGNMQCCEELFGKIKTRFGGIDVLVNNAGITRDNLLMKMSEEEFDAVIDTNLKGAFHCMKQVSRQMLKQKSGRIINISSVSGVMGNAGQANYCASKAGIIGLTKSAARELASRGITVNAVAPGFIQTDMTDALSDAVKTGIAAQIPMKKFGTTEDIAETVAFLASDKAKYITGQVICVDGGMAM